MKIRLARVALVGGLMSDVEAKDDPAPPRMKNTTDIPENVKATERDRARRVAVTG